MIIILSDCKINLLQTKINYTVNLHYCINFQLDLPKKIPF